jgi:ABC-2 type transport system permease protein
VGDPGVVDQDVQPSELAYHSSHDCRGRQVISLALTLCSFAGGLFIPLSQFPPALLTLARFTPLYGFKQLVHYPLVGGALQWGWILNLVVWLAIFVTGAAWCLRRDTARV